MRQIIAAVCWSVLRILLVWSEVELWIRRLILSLSAFSLAREKNCFSSWGDASTDTHTHQAESFRHTPLSFLWSHNEFKTPLHTNTYLLLQVSPSIPALSWTKQLLNQRLPQPVSFRSYCVAVPFLKSEVFDNCGLQSALPRDTPVVLFPSETLSRNQNL